LIRTFLDAGILVSATTGRNDLFDRARNILDDPECVLLSRDVVRLEVLPIAYDFHRQDNVDFYKMSFREVAPREVAPVVPLSDALIAQAHLEAQSAGRGALDALFGAGAKIGGSEEFVTTERSTTALYRVVGRMITVET
jgi:predicted nucleic acid-binding protein